MKKTFYVISFKDKLYVATKMYGVYQSTTDDIMKAVHFQSYEEAAKVCDKTKGGEIKEYIIQDIESYNLEADGLRAANIQLQSERDDAVARMTKMCGNVLDK